MKVVLLLSLFGATALCGQDLSYRVREEILDQRNPVTVNASIHGVTTLQFPAPIQSLESDGFTTKPNEEAADFYISPGVNWLSIRSLHPGAVQNLGVIIVGKVYEILVQTTPTNDFSVLFRFPREPKPTRRTASLWSPLRKNLP
jgi:hypothetical protein